MADLGSSTQLWTGMAAAKKSVARMPSHALPRRSMTRGADEGWKLIVGMKLVQNTKQEKVDNLLVKRQLYR